MTYQEKAYTFAQYTNKEYPFLALGEEAGEVLGKLAKFVRKNHVSVAGAVAFATDISKSTIRADLIKELGDVQWQLAACCTELGITLEDIQNVNIAKLSGREVRGTIVGDGDER